jgi:hypothetical protein
MNRIALMVLILLSPVAASAKDSAVNTVDPGFSKIANRPIAELERLIRVNNEGSYRAFSSDKIKSGYWEDQLSLSATNLTHATAANIDFSFNGPVGNTTYRQIKISVGDKEMFSSTVNPAMTGGCQSGGYVNSGFGTQSYIPGGCNFNFAYRIPLEKGILKDIASRYEGDNHGFLSVVIGDPAQPDKDVKMRIFYAELRAFANVMAKY